MSFVAVFTASAMGFTLLVPVLMVLVLMVYGAPAARRAVPVRTERRDEAVDGRVHITRRAA